MGNAGSGVGRLRGKDGLKAVDYYLVVPILAMTIIGLFVLQKVLSKGYAAYPGNYYRQIAATVGGILGALVLSLLDSHFMKIVGRIIYIVSLLLLILVPIDGYSLVATWGADSWLKLPVIGNFQPSELAKLGLIMVAADTFERMANKEYYDANWRITETGVGTNIFKASLNIDRQDGDYIQFRFYTELTGWDIDSSIGLKSNKDCQWDSNGKYKGKILTDGRYEGNYKFDVASAGTLDITVNMNTNKVEFKFTPDN